MSKSNSMPFKTKTSSNANKKMFENVRNSMKFHFKASKSNCIPLKFDVIQKRHQCHFQNSKKNILKNSQLIQSVNLKQCLKILI